MSETEHKQRQNHTSVSSSLLSCFVPTTAAAAATTAEDGGKISPPPPSTGNPNLTTFLYQTQAGFYSLTWSKTLFGHGHSFDLDFQPSSIDSNSPSFHLRVKPFLFWNKQGSKKLMKTRVYWDLTRARFGSGSDPVSGFYVVVVRDGEVSLLVGDLVKEAYVKTRAVRRRECCQDQALVLKTEHVFCSGDENRVYSTKTKIGGRIREISIDCGVKTDSNLSFNVDGKRVLQIKRLKWKFRGNERIDIGDDSVQVSWDVYNWLFEEQSKNRDYKHKHKHGVFMFRFENEIDCEEQEEEEEDRKMKIGVDWRRMLRKSLMRPARSSSLSSISMSSVSSSGCSSSVMDWDNGEDSELCSGFNGGFSLLVYVWKK